MYLLSEAEQRVRTGVRDAILLLCQTGLKFNTELSVDGLLALTVDKKHVFLISIKETLQASGPCTSNYDSTHLSTDGNQAVLNASSLSQSEVSDDQILLTDNGHECVPNVASSRIPAEMPSRCGGDPTQLDAKMLIKSDQESRRRQRKQRRTVCSSLDSPCPISSPSAMSAELSDQPYRVLGLTGSENGDIRICGDDECENGCCSDDVCKTLSLSGDLATSPPASVILAHSVSNDQSSVDCSEQRCNEVDCSLQLAIEYHKRLENETSVSPTLPDKGRLTDSEHTDEQSNCKQRSTVRQYVDHTTCPETASSTTSLESLHQTEPVLLENENSEATTLNEIQNDRCKMESSDNLSDITQTECQDSPTGFRLCANIKSEIVEPSTFRTDVVAELPSHSSGHSIQPTYARDYHQMSMMPQFPLSAVASLQPHFALLPKPFPWAVRTVPSVSPASLPPAQCGMLVDASSSSSAKSHNKTGRYPKTPLNVPMVNSYRRMNGVKGSPFLSPEVNICANCGVTRTTVWRRLENKEILCNACGCYYKLHKVHRPLSLVRQEIRSRCRGPKMSTLVKASKSRFNGVIVSQQSSPEVALNLTTSPRKDDAK